MKRASILSNARLFADLLMALCCTGTGTPDRAKSLSGSVHDSNGAALADVKVTVSNVNTGNVISIRANRSGHYQVPSLRKGVYNIEASAPGFSPAKAKNVIVPVAGLRRIDLSLKVGQAKVTTIDVGDVAAADRKQRLG